MSLRMNWVLGSVMLSACGGGENGAEPSLESTAPEAKKIVAPVKAEAPAEVVVETPEEIEALTCSMNAGQFLCPTPIGGKLARRRRF
jgi:hypothetical protein